MNLNFLLRVSLVAMVCACGSAEAKKRRRKKPSKKEMSAAQKEKNSAQIKKKFSYSMDDILDCLVIIKHQTATGSGFIAKMNGKSYIFTNQHVVLGGEKIRFTTVSGKQLRPKMVELSETRDVARFLIDSDIAFEISNTPKEKDLIGVFGNSDGAGVATELYGKIIKITPEIIEVSADFISGNSGSPILNLKKEVIGIASYVRYSVDEKIKKKGKETPSFTVKRFCFRVTDLKWKPVNWKKYNKKYYALFQKKEASINDFFTIIGEWAENPFQKFPVKRYSDSDLQKWAKQHNGMINKINRMRKKGVATAHQLKNVNEQIRNDLVDSANDLSKICAIKVRQLNMLSRQKDLTEFLQLEFERLSERLIFAGKELSIYADSLSKFNFFHFN